MKRLVDFCWYWLLAFKLAGDEVLGLRQNAALVEESRRLHRVLVERGGDGAMSEISKEQFEREYAARSSKTVEELRKYKTVRPCNCGEGGCQGWQSVSHAVAAELDAEEAERER